MFNAVVNKYVYIALDSDFSLKKKEREITDRVQEMDASLFTCLLYKLKEQHFIYF
jgi:hypothetical protein